MAFSLLNDSDDEIEELVVPSGPHSACQKSIQSLYKQIEALNATITKKDAIIEELHAADAMLKWADRSADEVSATTTMLTL